MLLLLLFCLTLYAARDNGLIKIGSVLIGLFICCFIRQCFIYSLLPFSSDGISLRIKRIAVVPFPTAVSTYAAAGAAVVADVDINAVVVDNNATAGAKCKQWFYTPLF